MSPTHRHALPTATRPSRAHPARLPLALTLALLGTAPAAAQLLSPPTALAAQPVLKGFKKAGNTLTRGQVRVTLDVTGGLIIGVLTEAPDAAGIARGLGAAWGIPEANLPKLTAQLTDPKLLMPIRNGLHTYADQDARQILAVHATGTGKSTRWRAYTAVKIWPASAFPPGKNTTGNLKAEGDLRIFSDFQCPYCQKLWFGELPVWKANPAQYRVTHYHFPLSFHPNAQSAAEATECAAAQGKFWPLADTLFMQFSVWTTQPPAKAQALYTEYARKAGLNAQTFTRCLTTRQTRSTVDAQTQAGHTLGVTGTPTVFLNGIKLSNYTDPQERATALRITTSKPSASALIGNRLKTFPTPR